MTTPPLTASPPPGSPFSLLIEAHKARTGVSDSELARRIGISRQHLFTWRTNGIRALPDHKHLTALAAVTEQPYEVILEAALRNTGHLPPHSLVLDESIDTLLSASARELAQELADRFITSPHRGTLPIIGPRVVLILSRLWHTQPDRATHFLRDYLDTRRKIDETPLPWEQVKEALWSELNGPLTPTECDAFLTYAHDHLPD